MLTSQKCQYALRGLFELAKHYGQGPVKIGEVAEAQAIPPRFLEIILGQLKQAGFVQSRRGAEGGYLLVRSPESLAVGEVIRFVDGPIGPVACVAGDPSDRCPLRGSCVFMPMWKKAQRAIAEVYDNTTFRDLLDEAVQDRGECVLSYVI